MLGFRISVTIIAEFLELKQNKMDNVFIKLHKAFCLLSVLQVLRKQNDREELD